jgi:hypothetical protein
VREDGVCIKDVHMQRQAYALASRRLLRQEVPQVRPEVSRVRAATWESCATEEIVLVTAPTTFSDGHLTVWPRTQTMHGNRVPVYRVAEREFARENTEERKHHSSARVQEPGDGNYFFPRYATKHIHAVWRMLMGIWARFFSPFRKIIPTPSKKLHRQGKNPPRVDICCTNTR